MEKKQTWLRLVQEKSAHYLNLGDGGFDERMRAHLVDCDYEGQTVTYAFPTQDWQINEKGGIHGGAIAGMFDAAFGVVANFTAGENEATTVDMSVSFLRGVDYGMELYLKVFIVKAGRSLIRQRAELTDAATGKLLANGGNLEDYLGYDNRCRINTPSTIGANWRWRVKRGALSDELQKEILFTTKLYGRMNWN